MSHSQSLPLFTAAEEQSTLIPRYCVKLVKESHVHYTSDKILGAKAVDGLLRSIGLDTQASEEFYALYLNTKNRIAGIELISKGTLNSSLVHPREVFKGAILANANAIIVAHNHPSGDVEPSNADRAVTEILVKTGDVLNIKVIDHVIVGNEGLFYSFRDSGLINN